MLAQRGRAPREVGKEALAVDVDQPTRLAEQRLELLLPRGTTSASGGCPARRIRATRIDRASSDPEARSRGPVRCPRMGCRQGQSTARSLHGPLVSCLRGGRKMRDAQQQRPRSVGGNTSSFKLRRRERTRRGDAQRRPSPDNVRATDVSARCGVTTVRAAGREISRRRSRQARGLRSAAPAW